MTCFFGLSSFLDDLFTNIKIIQLLHFVRHNECKSHQLPSWSWPSMDNKNRIYNHRSLKCDSGTCHTEKCFPHYFFSTCSLPNTLMRHPWTFIMTNYNQTIFISTTLTSNYEPEKFIHFPSQSHHYRQWEKSTPTNNTAFHINISRISIAV